MRIFQINTCGNLSTGSLAVEIACGLEKSGDCSVIAFARNDIAEGVDHYIIGNKRDVLFHAGMTRLTDRTGFYSKRATQKLIREIEHYEPDIIQLHNLHGYYINIEILFHFLRNYGRPVIWTLHDCWSFTGHCAYFDFIGCDKWENGCTDCPAINQYPKSYVDNSAQNYKRKKELFTLTENMTLVVPSYWLKERVEKSFLKKYPVEVIYNGINLECFHPDVDGMQIRREYGLEGKIIVLGVASTWTDRKGFSVFRSLAGKLPDPYQILLVGLNQNQRKKLDGNITGVGLISDQKKMAQFYAAADIFLNVSVEESFGLTTIEALACGTYSIVLENTACAEIAALSGGRIVGRNLEEIERAIYEYAPPQVSPSFRKLFSKEAYVNGMLQLYREKIRESKLR